MASDAKEVKTISKQTTASNASDGKTSKSSSDVKSSKSKADTPSANTKDATKGKDKDSESMVSSLLFNVTDHFAEAADDSGKGSTMKNSQAGYVHIRIQQRNGRKSLTTVQGLATDLDLKRILRFLKKTFSTNGTILRDEENGKVIQLQGDQRRNVLEFLTKCHICERPEIKVHGF